LIFFVLNFYQEPQGFKYFVKTGFYLFGG